MSSQSKVTPHLKRKIFGGSAPLVNTWIIPRTGDIESPAYYLILMSVISLVATVTIRRTLGGKLED